MSAPGAANPVRALRLLCALAAWAPVAPAAVWQPPPEKVTLLAICAHPDDEGIFFGGALPYYCGVLQVPTLLISMTSGDWSNPGSTLREDELRNAAWTYGLRCEPLFARFRDVPSHSLTNNPYVNTIDATWDYWADGVLQGDGSDVAAGRARAIAYVAEQIRRFRPDVVITHDLRGEYGHDSHRATALAVCHGVALAADASARETNLVSLPPWEVKKLYVHLYGFNRLFHTGWEEPYDELGGLTPRQVAEAGLEQHVSRGGPDVSTYYRKGENYDGYDSEWWGLYASIVGPDTPRPSGYAAGNFLEHVSFGNEPNRPPRFLSGSFSLPEAVANERYIGCTLARFATDPDRVAGDRLSFAKISGPAWLSVAANGALDGTPAESERGDNVFVMEVTDAVGASSRATVTVRVASRLALCWNFDEGQGARVADAWTTDRDGVLAGGAGWAPGREGTALRLDRTGAYAAAASLGLNADLTVAAWIRPDIVSGERAILSEAGSFSFKTSGSSLRFTTPQVRDHTCAARLRIGEWQHVAVTFRAGVAGGCRFYVNGVDSGVLDASGRSVTTNAAWVGRNQWGQHFSGLVDNLRVYRTALGADEIPALCGNHPPTFAVDPIEYTGLTRQNGELERSLAGAVEDADPDDKLTFRKTAGPAWLNVAADGALSGALAGAGVGTNAFGVRVLDRWGSSDEAELRIVVAFEPTYRLGIVRDGPDFRIEFIGRPGRPYRLQRSPDLVSWVSLPVRPSDALGRFTYTDAERPSPAFYRASGE